jgi:hypothetical protein
MRLSTISVTGSTAGASPLAVSLIAGTPALVSFAAVEAGGCAGGCDVTPHNISPPEVETTRDRAKAVAARKSLSCFIFAPIEIVVVCGGAQIAKCETNGKADCGRIIGRIDSKTLNACGIFRKHRERQSSHGFSETIAPPAR